MVLVRMHAAGRNQAHQMTGAAAGETAGDQVAQHRIGGKRSVFDSGIDARQILHHDPAGAEIHVAYFGIAHLTVGQADEMLGGIDQRVRAGRPELIPVRRTGQRDRIALAGRRIAPAVKDAKHDRARRGGAGGRHGGNIGIARETGNRSDGRRDPMLRLNWGPAGRPDRC